MSTTTPAVRRLVVLLTAAAVACGGCGVVGGERTDASAAGNGSRTGTFGDFGREGVSTEATAPTLSLGDEQFVVDAQEELTRRCMEERGLPYAPIRLHAHEPLRRIGHVAPAMLREQGYRETLPADLADSELVIETEDLFDGPTNGDLIAALSRGDQQRWLEAMAGPDGAARVELALPDGTTSSYARGTCYTEAITQLFGALEHFVNYLSGGSFVRRAAVEALHRDPGYQGAHARWVACLAAAGWDIPPLRADDPDLQRSYPEQLVATWYRELPVEQADARHLDLAAADAACQQETALDAVTAEAGRAALDDVAAEYGYDLLGRQELLQDVVARARRFLGAG